MNDAALKFLSEYQMSLWRYIVSKSCNVIPCLNISTMFYCKSLYCNIILNSVLPKGSSSPQAQKPRLQFCRRQIFYRKLRNQGCIFNRDWIGAVASRCFPHLSLALATEQTLKDLKRSRRHQRGGEESGFGQLSPPDFTEIHHRS